MKNFTLFILTILFLHIELSSQPGIGECTIGVAHGSATQDGRPLAWKTRDFAHVNMAIKYINYSNNDYDYVIVQDIEYGNYPTMGVNECGLSIFKAEIYDLDPAPSGPSNHVVMTHALAFCKTINEFQAYLDSTNTTGRTATGNFGMIDSTGAAVIFEVGGYEYWRFDAQDEPDGYIIRTNFSINGGGYAGIERYNRSCTLISDFYSSDSLNHRSLIRHHMRDFSDYNSQPYPVPFLEQLYPSTPWGYFPTSFSICNDMSVSASVIQGILPGEKPELSSMWTMLGNPAASIAVPYWPVGHPPDLSIGSPTAPLCDLAIDVREVMYEAEWINSHKLLDTLGGGIWTFTFPTEDMILDSTETLMNNWRGLDSIPVDAMLDAEEYFAEMAYNSLDSVFGIYVGVEQLPGDKQRSPVIIYPNPATHTISLLTESGIYVRSLKIMNMQGKVLVYQEIVDDQLTFNIGSFPAGFYIVRVITNQGVVVQKLVIQ